MSKQHLLVLGATGPAGLQFCESALEAGHKLTLFVRNPSKIPQNLAKHGNVNVIEGQITQEDRLRAASSSGASVFVSFLGPSTGHKGTPLVDGYKRIIAILTEHRFERAIILATASWVAPEDNVTIKWRLISGMVWAFAGAAYTDIRAIGDYVSSLSLDDIKWTIFRVPFLSNAGPAEVQCSHWIGLDRI